MKTNLTFLNLWIELTKIELACSHVVIFYIYNGAVLIHCRHIPMSHSLWLIGYDFPAENNSKIYARNHILCNWRRSTDPGPRISIQDIKYILYQMIPFLQFKHNHCFYFLNYAVIIIIPESGPHGPSGCFATCYFRYEVIVIFAPRFGFWCQIFHFSWNQKMFERGNSQRCCRHRRL